MTRALRFGSVCTGIGAADLAFVRLGWTPVFQSEIDPFCDAVLKERFPGVPNEGDFTAITAARVRDLGGIDVLVGGTPCQDYSVAGERAGLAGDDGQLALEYVGLVGRLRPRWVVWENVPGVLSSNVGRDFGAFLGALGDLGYGWAYRVLDGRWWGVPQRRRRVFLVAHPRDWAAPAAVLAVAESLRRDPAPRREAGPDLAGTLGGGAGSRGWAPDPDRMTFVPEVLPFDTTQVTSHLNYSTPRPGDPCHPLAAGAHPPAVAFAWQQGDDSPHTGTGRGRSWVARAGDYAGALSTTRHDAVAYAGAIGLDHTQDPVSIAEGAPALNQDGQAVYTVHNGQGDPNWDLDRTQCLDTEAPPAVFTDEVSRPITSHHKHDDLETETFVAALDDGTVRSLASHEQRLDPSVETMVAAAATVRRLTPRECERLQALPDNWTLVTYKGKPAADSQRYRAIGNAMIVNVLSWIGARLQLVEEVLRADRESPI